MRPVAFGILLSALLLGCTKSKRQPGAEPQPEEAAVAAPRPAPKPDARPPAIKKPAIVLPAPGPVAKAPPAPTLLTIAPRPVLARPNYFPLAKGSQWRHAHDSTKENRKPGEFDIFGGYDVIDTEIVGDAEKDGKVEYAVEVRPLSGRTVRRWASDHTTVYFPVSDFVTLEDKSGRPIDDPLVPVLKHPLTDGAKWSARVTGWLPAEFAKSLGADRCEVTYSISFQVLESETLTVLGKPRDTVPIRHTVGVDAEATFEQWQKKNPSKTKDDFLQQPDSQFLALGGLFPEEPVTTWYAEGIGPVRQRRPGGFLANPTRVDLREFSPAK